MIADDLHHVGIIQPEALLDEFLSVVCIDIEAILSMRPYMCDTTVRGLDEIIESFFQDLLLGILPDASDDLHVIIRDIPEECTFEHQALTILVLRMGRVELEHWYEQFAVQLSEEIAGLPGLIHQLLAL